MVAALPFVIYYALQHFPARVVTLLLLAFPILRAPGKAWVWLRSQGNMAIPILALAILAGGMLWYSNDPTLVLFYPVIMSGAILAAFAGSLLHPPSVVERIARLRTPDLPPEGVAYTRRVTQVWCGFFVSNGAIAAWTALAASREAWLLYNGLISYLLMGSLFAGEWLYRRLRFGAMQQS
jgi:uncharacterized membrane protein